MKKYLLKIALFFALMAVIDVVCGLVFDILRSKARGGQTRKNEYINNICEDDILILGSSKADHHYVPSVFEDSLGLTCYNAGEMGCGIIPAYIRYKMVSKRHALKLVIYELTPDYDYLRDDGYSQYLGVIRPYANQSTVKETYLDFSDDLEGLRLLSSMYRNNSKLIAILLPYLLDSIKVISICHSTGSSETEIAGYNHAYCDHIVALSEYAKERIIKRYHLKSGEKITSIPSQVAETPNAELLI